MNDDKASVKSSDVCNQSNILCDLLSNSDDIGPAPLQNALISIETFEVIANVLKFNTSIRFIDDINCTIDKL